MANPASEHAILLANHWARVVSYWLTLVLAVTSEWSRSRAPGFWISTVLITLCWPHVVYAIARRAREPRAAELRNVLIDSALGGVLAAALGFAVLPTLALVIPTLATIFRAGGQRLFAGALAAVAIGAVVGGAIYGFSFRLDTGKAADAVSIVLLVAFIFYFAAVARWQGGAIRQGKQALQVALEQQAATSGVMRVITTARADLDVVFSTIITSAVRLCGGVMGGVFRYDGDLLHLVAHHNYSPEALAAVLGERLTAVLGARGTRLVLDFRSLEYISSAGFRVLLLAAKHAEAAGSRLVLCGVAGKVRQLFDLAGFLDLLPLYASREESVASLR